MAGALFREVAVLLFVARSLFVDVVVKLKKIAGAKCWIFAKCTPFLGRVSSATGGCEITRSRSDYPRIIGRILVESIF